MLLEALTASHSVGMFELWSSEEVCRHSGDVTNWDGQPLALPAADAATSDQIIEFFQRMAAAGRGIRWAVLERSSGAFVGAVGFNALEDRAELAYHQLPRFWGRGMMGEACEAALAWAGGRGAREAVAYIDAVNVRSVRLVQRLGFRKTGEVRDGAEEFVVALDKNQSAPDIGS